MLLFHQLLHNHIDVVIVAIYVSFSAFVRGCLMCCTKAAESHVCTAQISRQTPIKGSISSLRVVITHKKVLVRSLRLLSVFSQNPFYLVLRSF